MIQTQTACPILTWPKALTLEPYQALESHQMQKVATVGLACLACVGFQMMGGWALAAGISLTCSTITLLSETFLRSHQNHDNSLIQPNICSKEVMSHIAFRLTVIPIVVALTTAFGIIPLQAVAAKILAGDLRIIFLVTIVAPIVEEILFRGFIQERLEDLATLIDRHVYQLSESTKQLGSTLIQSLFFGSLHITGSQVSTLAGKLIILFQTTILGVFFTYIKNTHDSLLPSIAIHSAHNTGMTLGLLASKLLPNKTLLG